ncbi:hypothetical protein SKAU_G00014050 [Synaphobranchus kaupii]|uniref:Secreted protein n=1 Tax=Synaphobranchus kaupii TaxID=118154 RepID=A0A9Q1GCC8_SYNKA|nr:hypothetical protein SKAU_G00014050 [Synaphobranchus kaupii]
MYCGSAACRALCVLSIDEFLSALQTWDCVFSVSVSPHSLESLSCPVECVFVWGVYLLSIHNTKDIMICVQFFCCHF